MRSAPNKALHLTGPALRSSERSCALRPARQVNASVSWTNEQNDGHPPCPRWCVGLRCLIGRRRSIRRRAVSLVLSARLGSDAWNDSRRVSDLFRVVLPLSPSSHQETPPDRAPEDSSRQTSDVCVGSVLPVAVRAWLSRASRRNYPGTCLWTCSSLAL